ncbi:MAG: methionine adenosyltransferase [Candidatus Aenigmarchaeota archaeon]|nr:methionine adenosyltransferase [Candidatus Aenigmarchaeota archaeon]MDW8149425.1 methionine adenosyltransferase [Candidatus Aenigmarchaeota archaeon]
MKIFVENIKNIPVSKLKTEIVERKGVGHPDTICDLICEEASINLSREYLKRFGRILHFNLDKALLAAGEAVNRFGGGRVIKPMKFIFGDRATFSFEGEEIDVEKVLINSAKSWFRNNMRFVEDDYVEYMIEVKRGSPSLVDIFKRKWGDSLGANDTSACVGYWPLTTLESLIINVEKYLNSKKFKKEFPESGEDVKIMGIRRNGKFNLITAIAMVDRFIKNEDEYFRVKEEINENIKNFVRANYGFNIDLTINSLDQRGRGEDGCYLTVTGTCAESGDSGQVGRGNKVNGIFSLFRPISNEAAAGKNPVSHVGKIYNFLSTEIAKEIYQNFEKEIEEVYVWLVSKIGHPISEPELVSVQIIPKKGKKITESKVKNIVEERLYKINKFSKLLYEGKIKGFL